MAGTLTVQNLQGPASGANANKIIISSGQTLDASAGVLTPSAGAVIQHVSNDIVTATSTASSSTTYVNYMSVAITPKFSNSVLFMGFNLFVYTPQNVTGRARFADSNGSSLSGYWGNWSAAGGLDAHLSGFWSYSPNSTSSQTIWLQISSALGQSIFGAARTASIWVQEIKQ